MVPISLLCFRFLHALQYDVLKPQEPSTLTPMFIFSFDKSASSGTSDAPFLTIYYLVPMAAFFILPSATSSATLHEFVM